jgi:hypothetical protein
MTNCEWLNSKLEAYFCDDLAGEDVRRFQAHLSLCAECRQQMDSFNQIDPLVRGVLQHRLVVAQMAVRGNGHSRGFKLVLAVAGGGTLAAALVLLVIGMGSTQQQNPALPVAVQQPPAISSPIEPDGIKKNSGQEQKVNLGKPLDGPPVQPAPQPHLDDALANGPDFAVADAAGYPFTLEKYRGRALLVGVVSPDQKTAVSNLEQLYEAFGSNSRVAILAVARHRDDKFRDAKFPLFFNNGSKLLGAREGEFRLLDPTGKMKLDGSLADPASVMRIRNELGQLGIR